MENPPLSNSSVVNSPSEYSHEENSTAENSPVFDNVFFIHHLLKMKREFVIAQNLVLNFS